MTDPIPARLAALKTMPLPDLKAEWRTLFGTEPPGYNRRFLESRLAYRIQELAYGGLKPETVRRLEALGEQFADRNVTRRRIRHDAMPIAGTRLLREWQGVEHTVTVLTDGYEWQGRPYRSLSAIARAITGTRWNGLRLLRAEEASGVWHEPRSRGPYDTADFAARSTPGSRPRRGSTGVQQPGRPARSRRGVHRQPAVRGLGLSATPTTTAASPVAPWTGRRCGRARRRRGRPVDFVVVYKIDRLSRSCGLRGAGRGVRRAGVAFVSVTQQFNTSTSMGRLTLNVLFSFAQFEREVIAERTRDKIAGLPAEGHVDGRERVPLGYVVQNRKLVVHEPDAAVVRSMFERFLRDRLGDGAGEGAAGRGRADHQGPADRQGLPLQVPEQPHLPRPRHPQGALMSATVPSATSDQPHRAPPRPRDMLPLPRLSSEVAMRSPSSPSTSSPIGPSAATRSPSSSTHGACRTKRCRRSRASSTTPSRPSSCRRKTRAHRARSNLHPGGRTPLRRAPQRRTAFSLAHAGAVLGRPVGASMVFEEIAGLVRAEVLRDGGTAIGARIAAPQPLEIGSEVPVAPLAACTGLPASAFAAEADAPRIASVGMRQVFAELPNLAALAAARPDAAAFVAAEAALPLDGAPLLLLLWTRTGNGSVRARMGPTLGVLEDPATGSAAGALGGLLANREEGEDLVIEQGVEGPP